MKTTTTILTVIAIILLYWAYDIKKPGITEVIILRDVTDTQIAQPNAQVIFSLFGLPYKWDGRIFQYSDISDVSYNQTKQARLELGNEWLSNELERDKEIETFKEEIMGIINNETNDKTEKTNSAIYLPLARELNELTNSKAKKRILIVYSDLMENTETLSFYKKEDFEKLKSNPELIKEVFEKQEALEALNGIEVYFIYQPTESQSDQKFQVISGFYKKLLEEKGAKVTISANLK